MAAFHTILVAHKYNLVASLAPRVPDGGGFGAVIWWMSADPAEYARRRSAVDIGGRINEIDLEIPRFWRSYNAICILCPWLI